MFECTWALGQLDQLLSTPQLDLAVRQRTIAGRPCHGHDLQLVSGGWHRKPSASAGRRHGVRPTMQVQSLHSVVFQRPSFPCKPCFLKAYTVRPIDSPTADPLCCAVSAAALVGLQVAASLRARPQRASAQPRHHADKRAING